MSIQFDIAKQIIAETCPNRKLKLENIRLFADIIQPKKYQKGDIILNEGDICNCLFYIEKGFIRQHYLRHDKDVIEFSASPLFLSHVSYFFSQATSISVK